MPAWRGDAAGLGATAARSSARKGAGGGGRVLTAGVGVRFGVQIAS